MILHEITFVRTRIICLWKYQSPEFQLAQLTSQFDAYWIHNMRTWTWILLTLRRWQSSLYHRYYCDLSKNDLFMSQKTTKSLFPIQASIWCREGDIRMETSITAAVFLLLQTPMWLLTSCTGGLDRMSTRRSLSSFSSRRHIKTWANL